MKEWKVRITTKYLKIEKIEIVKVLKEIAEGYIVVNEFWDDKKTQLDHIQMYIQTDISERKFRKLVKDMLSEGGNKAFSMDNRHSDWNGYKGYLLKYSDTEVLGSSYTPEELNHYRDYYKKVSVASRPRSKANCILENDLQELLSNVKEQMNIRDIAKIVVNYYKEKQKVIHLANMRQLIWSIYAYSQEDNDALIDQLIDYGDDGLRDLDQRQRKFDGRQYPPDF